MCAAAARVLPSCACSTRALGHVLRIVESTGALSSITYLLTYRGPALQDTPGVGVVQASESRGPVSRAICVPQLTPPPLRVRTRRGDGGVYYTRNKYHGPGRGHTRVRHDPTLARDVESAPRPGGACDTLNKNAPPKNEEQKK